MNISDGNIDVVTDIGPEISLLDYCLVCWNHDHGAGDRSSQHCSQQHRPAITLLPDTSIRNFRVCHQDLYCHQDLNSFTNFKLYTVKMSSASALQQDCCSHRLFKSHFCWEVWKRRRSKSKDQNSDPRKLTIENSENLKIFFKTQILQTSRE